MSTKTSAPYSVREEIANSLSHGLGVALSILGLVFLLSEAIDHQADVLTITSFAVYGSSMILLFLASTLYHAVSNPKAKRALKTFDHCAIYLLIAGSYTPFLLVSLRTPLAVSLMVIIWLIAIFGIVMKIAFMEKFKRFSLGTYLVMGWLSLIVIYQLATSIDVGGLILLAAGGVIYSLGVIFFVVERIPYNHAIWHGFVLAGCACHFFSIFYYVKPV